MKFKLTYPNGSFEEYADFETIQNKLGKIAQEDDTAIFKIEIFFEALRDMEGKIFSATIRSTAPNLIEYVNDVQEISQSGHDAGVRMKDFVSQQD